ncbi:UNVERIFIED_CONTAM: 3'-5' exonuclease [Siphonaria sp. JEL0065]|nr:3'-5' exonuclease [Siphonaria sp. JEL0065]
MSEERKPRTKKAKKSEAKKQAEVEAPKHWFIDPSLSADPIAKHFRTLFESEEGNEALLTTSVVDTTTIPRLESLLAVDCEMVEVASIIYLSKEEEEAKNLPPEMRGKPKTLLQSQLARVSIVDAYGNVVLDSFVLPEDPIVDYRTEWSGITSEKLEGAPSFAEISKRINRIITDDSVVVGQSIDNDLKVMKVDVPMKRIRDTALFYQRFHPHSRTFGLKNMAKWCLDLQIQDGQHDSVIDARTALLVYRQVRNVWESTHPLHDPYPKNYWDPRPPPIELHPDLPEGFKAAVEELKTHQRPTPHYQSFKPGQPTPAVPQAATFAPDLSPPKPIQTIPIHITMDAISAPTIAPTVRFTMTGPPQRVSADGTTSTYNPIKLIATPQKRDPTPNTLSDPSNPTDAADSTIDTLEDTTPYIPNSIAPTIAYPMLQPPSTAPNPSNQITTTHLIKAFYPPTIHSALKNAEKSGIMRLNGAPYWVVPSGTIVDPDVNQVSVEKVLEGLRVDTSVPGKRALAKKRKREEEVEDGEGEKDEMDVDAKEKPAASTTTPATTAQKLVDADGNPIMTGRLKRTAEWLKKMEEKDKAKKQREYARKKLKKAEFMAKLAVKDAAAGGVKPAIKKVKVGDEGGSAVVAVQEFLKVVGSVNDPVVPVAGIAETVVESAAKVAKKGSKKKDAVVAVTKPEDAVVAETAPESSTESAPEPSTEPKKGKSKKQKPVEALITVEPAVATETTPLPKSKKSKKEVVKEEENETLAVKEEPEPTTRKSNRSKKADSSVEEQVVEPVVKKESSKKSKKDSVVAVESTEEKVKREQKCTKKAEEKVAQVVGDSPKKSKKSEKAEKSVDVEMEVKQVKEKSLKKRSKPADEDDTDVAETRSSKRIKKEEVVEDVETVKKSKKSKKVVVEESVQEEVKKSKKKSKKQGGEDDDNESEPKKAKKSKKEGKK